MSRAHETTAEAAPSRIEGTPRMPSRIEALPHPYHLIHDIPVEIEVVSSAEAVAHLREAHMAMSGDDPQDAVEGLEAFILDCLDDCKDAAPDTFGPIPAR